MRCLAVEDDSSIRDLIRLLIERAGHSCATAGSLSEALAEDTAALDVALVDLELPDTAMAEAVAQLRAAAPHLKVLVVSGYCDPKHVLAALDAGASGYLLKDELSETLIDSLHAVRAGHAPLSARVAAIVVRQLQSRRVVSVR